MSNSISNDILDNNINENNNLDNSNCVIRRTLSCFVNVSKIDPTVGNIPQSNIANLEERLIKLDTKIDSNEKNAVKDLVLENDKVKLISKNGITSSEFEVEDLSNVLASSHESTRIVEFD